MIQNKSNNYYNRGQALMMVVLTMFVGLTIVLVVFMNSLAQLQLSTTQEQSERAFNVAESGIENILSEDINNIASGNRDITDYAGFDANVNTEELSSYDYLIKQNDTGEIQLKSSTTTTNKVEIYWTNENSTDPNTGEFPNSVACSAAGMIVEKWSGQTTAPTPTAAVTPTTAPTNTATPIATATTIPSPTTTAIPSPTTNPCSFTGQQTIVLQPIPNNGYTGVLDTYIANSLTTTYSSEVTFKTEYYWENVNGLLGFDLTGKLPFTEPIVIDSAALDVFVDSWAGGTDSATNMIFGLLTKPFDNTATWLNAKTGSAWTTPGGDYSTNTTKYFNNSRTFFNIDITQLAKDWYANRPSNQLGILTKIPARGNYGFRIASSEYTTDYLRRPKLTLKYSCQTAMSQTSSRSLLAVNDQNNEDKVLGVTTTDGGVSVTRMTYQPFGCTTAIGPSNKKGPMETVGTSWDMAADGSTQVFESGITYMNKVSITIDPTKDIMLRVRPIYNSASIRAKSGTAEDLPIQQHEFQSGAQVTGAGESRALQVVRTVPQLPSIFDYVLFSGENPIVK